jgi:transcriptional regulator with XRE-family HTH domain
MTNQTFGAYFKEKRIAAGLTLRRFCEIYHFDPGNVSRWERNLLPPPKSEDSLRSIAIALRLEDGSADWQLLFDLAAATNGLLPADLRANANMIARMPLVFRTLRGEPLTEDKLRELYEAIKEA